MTFQFLADYPKAVVAVVPGGSEELASLVREQEDERNPGTVWLLDREGVRVRLRLPPEVTSEPSRWTHTTFKASAADVVLIDVEAVTTEEAREKLLRLFSRKSMDGVWVFNRSPGGELTMQMFLDHTAVADPKNWVKLRVIGG